MQHTRCFLEIQNCTKTEENYVKFLEILWNNAHSIFPINVSSSHFSNIWIP